MLAHRTGTLIWFSSSNSLVYLKVTILSYRCYIAHHYTWRFDDSIKSAGVETSFHTNTPDKGAHPGFDSDPSTVFVRCLSLFIYVSFEFSQHSREEVNASGVWMLIVMVACCLTEAADGFAFIQSMALQWISWFVFLGRGRSKVQKDFEVNFKCYKVF